MNTTLKTCRSCGRLFSALDGADRCGNCVESETTIFRLIENAVLLDGMTDVHVIAATLELDEDVVNDVIDQHGYLADRVESPATCRACGERPQKRGRDYCTVCLVDLEADLRDMTAILGRQIAVRDRRPESRMRGMSVENALREKQRRTGHHRFDPVPRNIKRGR